VDVNGYDRAVFEFWRGNLAGTSATFKAFFEQADEPGGDPTVSPFDPVNPWSNIITPITTVNTSAIVEFDLTKKYLRLRVLLTEVEAAITLFAVGSIRRRVPQIG
jgi:hypothetical protein